MASHKKKREKALEKMREEMRAERSKSASEKIKDMLEAEEFQCSEHNEFLSLIAGLMNHERLQKKSNKTLGSELSKLKEEKWKDEQLSKMKEELDHMRKEYYNGFPISDEEVAAIRKWQDKHLSEKHSGKPWEFGAIGGNFTYEFTPTSVGVVCKVKCLCGEEFCFRDL